MLFVIYLSFLSLAKADDFPAKPVWEYGVGVGYIQFEHYPSSSQKRDLFLPFPTFQYRGEVLRADDRDGARAYLLKSKSYDVEVSGSFHPALDSKDNEARAGMDPLPWSVALGPQLVIGRDSDLEFKLGLFQAVTSDFSATKTKGLLNRWALQYSWHSPAPLDAQKTITSHGHLELNVEAADKEFLSTYFDVPQSSVTADRSYYESLAGLLSYEISFFETLQSGRTSFYIGAGLTNYMYSANRSSPLHKRDQNITGYVGLTYRIGESERAAVQEKDTRGLINSWRQKHIVP